MLELAVLGLLNESPMHGYELKRRLSDLGFWRVSFGSLYPALKRLERKDYVIVSPGGTRRKVYEITPAGRARFQELLESDGADEEREFSLKLAFFRYLEPDRRLGLLERRRATLISRLSDSREAIRSSASRAKRRMDRYTLALMERSVQSVEADIAWLDDLIESERAERPRRRERGSPDAAPEIS